MLTHGMNLGARATILADKNDASEEIARIRRRLADLDAERTGLRANWKRLSSRS